MSTWPSTIQRQNDRMSGQSC